MRGTAIAGRTPGLGQCNGCVGHCVLRACMRVEAVMLIKRKVLGFPNVSDSGLVNDESFVNNVYCPDFAKISAVMLTMF